MDVVKGDMAEVEVMEDSRIQNVGTTGHGTSAGATPDGKSQKKKKKSM